MAQKTKLRDFIAANEIDDENPVDCKHRFKRMLGFACHSMEYHGIQI